MASSNRNIVQKCKIFLPSLLLLLLTSALGQLDIPTELQSGSYGGEPINKGSALDLKVVLNSLVDNVNKTGYTISSRGENGNKVYGLAQCRGDLNASACQACVSNATKTENSSDCEGYSFGSIMLNGCFVRYANHNFYSQFNLADAAPFIICDNIKINGTDENTRMADWSVASLSTRVVESAASSNVSYSTLNESSGVYSMAQCWRDLTMGQCSQCLNRLYTNLSRCPAGTSDGEAFNDNCMVRYAKHKFYTDDVPLLSLSLSIATGSGQLDIPTEFQSRSCGGELIKKRRALEGNLEVVLNSLVDNVNKTGYNISWSGENRNKMYGLAQCRGDLNASACRACVSNATKTLSSGCEGQSSGSINLNGCFVRYDTSDFYSKLDMKTSSYCGNRTSANLDPSIAPLLSNLVNDSVSSDVGFSTRNGSGIYGLAQCWRDLNTSLCRKCLEIGTQKLSSCFNESEGLGFYQNCMIKYEKYKFYGDAGLLSSIQSGPSRSTNQAPTPLSGPSRETNEGKTTRSLVLGLSIAGVVSVVFMFVVFVNWKRKVTHPLFKNSLPGYYKPSSELSTAISKSKLNYKFQTLQIATQNFNPKNKIGQGGFGLVYKGVMVDGREIAVKRLFFNREESAREFFNEVNLISCVQHKNLVKLLGCSVDGPDKLLVYKYLPNKSLDQFLFGSTSMIDRVYF